MPEPGAGRVLALDWGTKRFGVALSDPTRLLAQPLTTLKRRPGHRPPVREILDLITRHEVALVVGGLPLTPEGEEGDARAECLEAISRCVAEIALGHLAAG